MELKRPLSVKSFGEFKTIFVFHIEYVQVIFFS